VLRPFVSLSLAKCEFLKIHCFSTSYSNYQAVNITNKLKLGVKMEISLSLSSIIVSPLDTYCFISKISRFQHSLESKECVKRWTHEYLSDSGWWVNPSTAMTLESHQFIISQTCRCSNFGCLLQPTWELEQITPTKTPLSLVTQSKSMKDLTCLQKVASQVWHWFHSHTLFSAFMPDMHAHSFMLLIF